jgi:hypothetical protein
MSVVDDFRSRFDELGRFRDGDGTLDIMFATRGGGRFPGKLYFRAGLCVRAEMEGGGDWVHPDNSPIHGIRFLLDFGDEWLHDAAIDHGRVIALDAARNALSKRDFLANVRSARNLFFHRVAPDSSIVDTQAVEERLMRAALWLTPRAVAGFDASDFPELGTDRQVELMNLVQSFQTIVNQVPADRPATKEQFGNATVTFAKILEILTPYLPIADEVADVEVALQSVEFPPWVLSWDYELASDSDGSDAVWVNVFTDEQSLPRTRLGRAASELTSRIRTALDTHQVHRWPYIRLKTALEHKVG